MYGAARPSYLGMLDPIHNQGVRIALGAYRTSPVDSLLAEANEPCLRLRRQRLGLQYAVKLKSTPDNPAFKSVHQILVSTVQLFTKNPNKQQPFGLRVREDMENLEILDEEVESFTFPTWPPWKLSQLNIDLDLTRYNKSTTSKETFHRAFKNLSEKYSERTCIFTDGSKDFGSVGAAAYSISNCLQQKLNGCSSIFTAEATAIDLALNLIKESSETSFIIFSDSLSCLKALKSVNIHDMRISNLIEKVNALLPEKDIVFAWVPGHVSIEGNDHADFLAKESSKFAPPPVFAPVPHTDFKQVIKLGIWNHRKNNWSIKKTKLNKVIPELVPRKPVDLPRQHESLISRLRIGHTPYTHLHLLLREEPPFCVGCNTAMTVEHILLHCVDFQLIRRKYYRVSTMQDLFGVVDSLRIVGFLREIGLYGKL